MRTTRESLREQVWRGQRANFATLASAVLAILSLATVFVWNRVQTEHRDEEVRRYTTVSMARANDEMAAQLNRIRKQQADLTIQLEALLASRKETGRGTRQYDDVLARAIAAEHGLKDVKTQIDHFYTLLGDDPEKKISVVLLTKDLQQIQKDSIKDLGTLRDEYKNDIANLREDSKSNFEFIKWALGLVGISNLLAPATTFFSNRGKLLPPASEAKADTVG